MMKMFNLTMLIGLLALCVTGCDVFKAGLGEECLSDGDCAYDYNCIECQQRSVCHFFDDNPDFVCRNDGGADGPGVGGPSCGAYDGPTADIQRDVQCQAAWSAICAGQSASAYCSIYNASGWGSPGNCPYCQ